MAEGEEDGDGEDGEEGEVIEERTSDGKIEKGWRIGYIYMGMVIK